MFYQVFVWSLQWAGLGVYPDRDHLGILFSATHHPARWKVAGERICGEYVAAFSELRGDWKWQKEALYLRDNYNVNRMCHYCRAHKRIRRLIYTQFSRSSRLRQTRYTWRQIRDWLSSDEFKGWLYYIPGFSLLRCWVDALHCLDLGILQSIIPSALAELVDEGVWVGGDRGEQYLRAHTDYRRWCNSRGEVPCPKFKASKWRPPGDFPMLSQGLAKGHMTRMLQFWVRDVCIRRGITKSAHGRIRLAMLEALCLYDVICSRNTRFVVAEDVELLKDAAETALICFNALAVESVGRDELLWQMKPKAHMLTHQAFDQAEWANPRVVHCYSDEDMLGRIKKMLHRCHGATAGRRATHRYFIMFGVRLWRMLWKLRVAQLMLDD